MTPEHIKIMRHALGLDHLGRGASFRNHFVTGPGTTDWPLCQELVEMHMMARNERPGLAGGLIDATDYLFWVTEYGARFARDRHEFDVEPKKTISQLRYRRFLDADTGMTFGEWLKAHKQ